MSWEILLLVAVQGLLVFLVGLMLGYFKRPNQTNGASKELLKLCKTAIFEIEESTRRSNVQLNCLRQRLSDFDRKMNDKRLLSPIGELREHVRVLQQEVRSLQMHSETLSRAARELDGDSPVAESGSTTKSNSAVPADSSSDSDLQSFLMAVEEKAGSGMPLHDLLGFVYDEIQPFVPCQRMGFAKIDHVADIVTADWYRSEKSGLLTSGYSAPLSKSSLRFIASTGRPRVLNNLPKYLRQHPESTSTRLIVSEGFSSSLTLPVSAGGTSVAFLFLSSTSINGFGKDSVVIAQQVVGRISLSSHLTESIVSVEPAMSE